MRTTILKFAVLTLTVTAALVFVFPTHAQEPLELPAIQHEACQGVSSSNLIPNVECVIAMRSNPEPPASEIPRDGFTLNNYSFWQVAPGVTNLYDSPGGRLIGQMPDGFNFVQALDTSVNGWVQIRGGQWVSEDSVSFYNPSEFRGVQVLNDLEQPFAWVLSNLFTSEYPGGPQSTENGRLLLRYDRVNIFSEVLHDDGWVWYMVGPNQWIEQRNLALAQRVDRPEGVRGRWIAVDLYEQTAVAYEDDTPVFATLVSSGLANFDTNEGIFTVWARPAVDGMSGATGAPDAYALQSVPWVMYFDNDISIHGTYWHDGFGHRRSHGCVNMSISDARWLFEWTSENPYINDEGMPETFVWVYSTGVYGTNNR